MRTKPKAKPKLNLNRAQQDILLRHRAVWAEPKLSPAQERWLDRQLALAVGDRYAADYWVEVARQRRARP